MKIEGDCTDRGLFLTCYFVSPGKTKLKTISFQVDTGSRATLISETDAKKLGVNYRNLKPSPRAIYGLGGKVRPYGLSGVVFIFDTDQGMKEVPFDSVEVIEYTGRKRDVQEQMLGFPSLLGWDFFWKKKVKIEIDCVEKKFYIVS